MTHTWTARHTSICVERSLSTSARLLWEWLVNHSTNIYSEVEFDLAKFNRWVARRRDKGGYDPRTLKRAATELTEKGIAIDLAENRFKWNWRRWKFEDIYPKKQTSKPCPKGAVNADFEGLNDGAVSEDVTAAAALDLNQQEIIDTCSEAGINYSKPEAITWAKLAEVKAAIALFFYRGGFSLGSDGLSRIENPQGYLIKAIKREWIYEQENLHVTGVHLAELTNNS